MKPRFYPSNTLQVRLIEKQASGDDSGDDVAVLKDWSQQTPNPLNCLASERLGFVCSEVVRENSAHIQTITWSTVILSLLGKDVSNPIVEKHQIALPHRVGSVLQRIVFPKICKTYLRTGCLTSVYFFSLEL